MFTVLTKKPKLMILVPSSLESDLITDYYLKPLKKLLGNKDFIIAEMDTDNDLKTLKQIVSNNIFPALKKYDIRAMYVVGTRLMKCFSPSTASSLLATYITKEEVNISYLPNASAVFVNINAKVQIQTSLAIAKHMIKGLPLVNNKSKNMVILNRATAKDLKKCIYTKDVFVDIEGFSLEFWKCGIATIAFKNHKGLTLGLYVDYMPIDVYMKHYQDVDIVEIYDEVQAVRIDNQEVKKILADWFSQKKFKLILHNASFDLTILLYELYMNGIDDREGLLNGLDILTHSFEDTYLLTYIKNNDTQHTPHGLKAITMYFMGNYGIDVKDITKVKPEELIYYNGDDVIATEKAFEDIVIPKEQTFLYEEVFKEGTVLFIDIMLSGMPYDKKMLADLGDPLEQEVIDLTQEIRDTAIVKKYQHKRKKKLFKKKHEEWKNKKVPWDEFEIDEFNPNSNVQLGDLLFKVARLPVIEATKKGNPSTGKKSLEALGKIVKDGDLKQILDGLTKLSESSTLLSTLIPAFKKFSLKKQGTRFVMGKFKFPGCVSGRPSSSNPNLLNLPSTGSAYAKPFKDCIRPPKGKLLLGADYSSLEHRVNALFTGDPNMLDEYTSGLDGHAFRAFFYFRDRLKKLDPKLVKDIDKALKERDKLLNKGKK